MILHCVSCENPDPLRAYNTVRGEMGQYEQSLLSKPEIVLLTKTDVTDQKTLSKAVKSFQKDGLEVLTVSILDDASIKSLSDNLVKILQKM